MDPITAALAGGVIEGGLSFLGQSSANRANRSMAREQMAFQERMSNTAYQRAMQDMRKAGLNPILAGKLGGATAPPGAQSTAMNELSGFSGTTAKGLEARRIKTDIANSESQILLNKANSAKAVQEAKNLGFKGTILEKEAIIPGAINTGVDVFKNLKVNGKPWWELLGVKVRNKGDKK